MTTHTISPATLPLWRDVAALLDLFVRAFGAAAQLMAKRTLHARDARDATRWLADIEATVRRLLFVETATMELKPAMARKGVAPPMKVAPTSYNPNAYREMMLGGGGLIRIGAHLPRLDDAANWKVSFKLGAEQCPSARETAAAPPAITAAPRDPWPVKRQVSVEKIARRLEAVRRVIADPGPWVRRLARKLHRRPRLAATLSKPPQRRWRTPCGAVLPEACALAPVTLHKRE